MTQEQTQYPQAQSAEYNVQLEDAKRSRTRDGRVRVRLTVAPDHFPFAGSLWPTGTSEGVISVKDLARAYKMLESNKKIDSKGKVLIEDVASVAAANLEESILEHARANYGYDKAGSDTARKAALERARATAPTSLPHEFTLITKREPLPILKIEELDADLPSILDEEETRQHAKVARTLSNEIARQNGAEKQQNQNSQKR